VLSRLPGLVSVLTIALAITATGMPYAHGQEAATDRGPSGLPLPRFVSLKSGRVNLRIGPGKDYSVSWRYVKPGLPVEIIQEYDNWRRIRDAEGTDGWVNQSLLSGKRTAIAAPWKKGDENSMVSLFRAASDGSGRAAALEPGVLTHVASCDGNWCKVEAGNIEGFIRQSEIWGAYPGEIIED
jgi:SH3-like domain-containing protein